MTNYKLLLLALLLPFASGITRAQSSASNSPYSRFGLGTLNEQSQGFNQGMGGVALGMRSSRFINMQNPASYSAIDSLSFLFDVGMSLQQGSFKSGNSKINANNTSLNYVSAAFRIRKGLGMSLGFLPYTTIGYNFSNTETTGTAYPSGNVITSESSYYGDGGLHQAYIGLGWELFKNFSVGANLSFLWGNYNHTISQQFSEGGMVSSTYNGLNVHYKAALSTYKLDLGAQYSFALNEANELTLGVAGSIGHKMNNAATLYHFTNNGDSIVKRAPNAFELPHAFGAGVTWKYKRKWIVGVDVRQELWSQCQLPTTVRKTSTNEVDYNALEGAYLDCTKVAAGFEYVPNDLSGNYFNRIRYRFGASYASPYTKVDGADGPSTYSLSAGVGLPISKDASKRTVVNVSVQWQRVDPSVATMITEDYLKLNIGITFNERWFMKWKIN